MEIGESVVQHFESVSLIEVNEKSLLECICNCSMRDGIPFKNLVSDLSDSTNYMRGKEEGLKNFYEAKLRGIHLLGLHLEGRWSPLKCERMRTRRVGSNVNASIRL